MTSLVRKSYLEIRSGCLVDAHMVVMHLLVVHLLQAPKGISSSAVRLTATEHGTVQTWCHTAQRTAHMIGLVRILCPASAQ